MTEVLSVQDIRRQYGDDSSKRELCKSYDLFLLERSIRDISNELLGANLLADRRSLTKRCRWSFRGDEEGSRARSSDPSPRSVDQIDRSREKQDADVLSRASGEEHQVPLPRDRLYDAL